MAKGKKRFTAILLILLLAAIPVLAETQIPFLSEPEYYSNLEDGETEDFSGLEETEEPLSSEETEEPLETEYPHNVNETEDSDNTNEPDNAEEPSDTYEVEESLPLEEVEIYEPEEAYLQPAELDISAELSGLSASVWNGDVAEAFEDGSGSRHDPYRISEASHLALLAENVNNGISYNGRFFILTSDIDLNSLPWTPIGAFLENRQRSFQGNFDGSNHTISNLNVNVSYNNAGLFGCAAVASGRVAISNLNVVDANVTGNNYVGIIVGQGNVKNSTASGYVSGNNNVGGIVGNAHGITDCINHATVNGNENISGIVDI